jgi:nicotinate phosphoribosyltransferase
MRNVSPLLTDLYQINMIQAYLDHGDTDTAVFELFVRSLPARRGFLLAAGLEQALDYLENLRFSADEIAWLKSTGRFRNTLLDYLGDLRFTGDVHAMPEGTAFFVNEPILRVTAPLPQAQLVESRLINILHFETLVASKAARCVLAAPNKLLVDFGCGSGSARRASELSCRFCRDGHSAGRPSLRYTAVRHDGPFLHRSARRRNDGVREFRPGASR